MSTPKVSVVLVTFGRTDAVLDTLADLLKQDYPNFDVTVIDQNPQPLQAFIDVAASAAGKIRIFHLLPPHMCVARNIGVKATTGEIVVFVDDDIRCAPGFLAAHARRFQNPDVGGVAGWIDAATDARKWMPERSEVEYPIGCNMAYRRSVIEGAGGFDPHFKPFPALGEEKDFAFRVRRLGHKIVVARDALLFHCVNPSGGSRGGDPQQYWKDTTSCHVMLFLKTRPWHEKLVMPLWLLKLRRTLNRLAGGAFRLDSFVEGVKGGFEITRQSRESGNFLEMTPRPRPVEMQNEK